jgi:hypothetical protein
VERAKGFGGRGKVRPDKVRDGRDRGKEKAGGGGAGGSSSILHNQNTHPTHVGSLKAQTHSSLPPNTITPIPTSLKQKHVQYSHLKKKFFNTMGTYPSQPQVLKTHSSLHNFLFQQPFLGMTPSPLSLTHDPNTYRFICNITMWFPRHISAKQAILRQNQKKGEQRGAELPPQRQKLCTPSPSTPPHYPLSNTFLLIYSVVLSPTWFPHTMLPKTQQLPTPARETGKRQERGVGSFFPSQKELNHRIVWIYWLEDEKETQQHET